MRRKRKKRDILKGRGHQAAAAGWRHGQPVMSSGTEGNECVDVLQEDISKMTIFGTTMVREAKAREGEREGRKAGWVMG